MALTADQIQARIDTLQSYRDAGVTRVRHGNDETFFQSLEAMDRTLANLKAALVVAQGGTPRPRVGYVTQTDKGFGRVPCGLGPYWELD
jgi:hypothetical protein